MRKILCPKCKTETDPRKQMCQYCGKYIIITELEEKDQKLLKDIWDRGEAELQQDRSRRLRRSRKSRTTKDDDLFADLEPLNLGEGVVVGRPSEHSELSPLREKIEPEGKSKAEEQTEDSQPDFLTKSKLLKKVQEDYDLFGDLDE